MITSQTQKQKIIFACQWYKDRKRTWSGTAWALYHALQDNFEVEDFVIKEKLSSKIRRRILLKIKGRTYASNMKLNLIRDTNRRFRREYGDSEEVVFQFMECPSTTYTHNYVYQDLCIEYIPVLRESNPKAFSYSEFQTVDEKELAERIQIQKKFYQHCKGIFTMSHWLADFLVQECGISVDKVHAVGGGINVKIADIDVGSRKGNKILFVGRNFERKGGEIVCKAFHILKNELMPEAELYIAGPVERPAAAQGEGVFFLGDINREELEKYYQKCDVFCMPSYFEAYGLVFVEALCNGLPCIGRKAFAMEEFIEDGVTGRLLPEDDERLLAQMMLQLLTDKEIAQNVQDKVAWYVKEYSWDNVARKIERVILETEKCPK